MAVITMCSNLLFKVYIFAYLGESVIGFERSSVCMCYFALCSVFYVLRTYKQDGSSQGDYCSNKSATGAFSNKIKWPR